MSSYVALYRKFRPARFDEVVGQEHIEKTLKNQIIQNRVGHAYIFSGGRGSGKTSTAKILARAVNCLDPQDGEPCNKCSNCLLALSGSLVDITEMDAASNNGVDNIRDIREEVEFIPTTAKYRVYIIDEVHMLSTGAFNALLKTLEEPPAHVIFILATTEPQKLPATILSRCQRFDFKRISVDDIIKRLKYIVSESKISIEDGALRLIATLADGAMRDAISILDRCVSDGDEIITEEKIKMLSGVPEFSYLEDITKALIRKDSDKVLNISTNIINEGKDLNVFIWELIKFQRDVVLAGLEGNITSYSNEENNKLLSLYKESNKMCFLNLISKLSEIQTSMKWSIEPSIMFEAGLIRICFEDGGNPVNNTSTTNSLPTNQTTNSASNGMQFSNDEIKAKLLTNLNENGKIRLQSDLANTKIELKEDGILHIIFSGQLPMVTKANFQKEESKIAIKNAVKAVFGREISVKYDNFK